MKQENNSGPVSDVAAEGSYRDYPKLAKLDVALNEESFHSQKCCFFSCKLLNDGVGAGDIS